jgi:hypothetical protein
MRSKIIKLPIISCAAAREACITYLSNLAKQITLIFIQFYILLLILVLHLLI